jgi:hypothetical protein
MLGVEPIRPLPQRNATTERKKDFSEYYTPDVVPHARRIFGPYLRQWGYEFPASWGNEPLSNWNQVEYHFYTFFRRLYWIFLRERV